MFFRMPRFIRRYFRRKMSPMQEEDAMSWKSKLSFLYMFFAWNAAGVVMYQIAKGNKHWPTTMGLTSKEEDEIRPAVYYANVLGVEKADVMRVSGFKVTKTTLDKEQIEAAARIRAKAQEEAEKAAKEGAEMA